MRLDSLQERYSKAIYGEDIQPLKSLIAETRNFTAQARINIYRNNTLGSLKSTLSQIFPVCETLVGTNYFSQLATSHILKNPSQHHNLDCYGETFSLTIKNLVTEHIELEDVAYLADVAQLEWLLHQSYYAPDRMCFDLQRFSSLATEQQMQVRFILAKDVALMDSPYPVSDIWNQHQQKDVGFTDYNVEDKQHSYVLVQREKWQSQPQLINAALYHLLVVISQGALLLELTPHLKKSPQDIAALIQRGLVSDFEICC
ncbi:MAG: DNA-binding domain-containing protein [Thiotrichaceae bacterium]